MALLLAFLPMHFAAGMPAAGNVMTLSREAHISLLTCSPGEAIWAQYGHSAIRVTDPLTRLDVVFNYGLFDFSSDAFIWRFVKGETDYILGFCSTAAFMREYFEENRRVTEQTLNLRDGEKQRLWEALCLNSQPENRTYRYNFFYDNCATRARVIIEKNLDDPVTYLPANDGRPLRETVNRCTENHPWARLGISLLVASPADAPASALDQLFAPEAMQEAFATATVGSGDEERPLTAATRELCSINTDIPAPSSRLPHPLFVFWFVCGAAFLLSLREWGTVFHPERFHRTHYLDVVFFAAAGLTGTVIFFMNFFSQHPAVNHNWLLVWLQPLHLIFAVALFFPAFRKSRIPSIYLTVNLLPFLFALAAWQRIPQYFDPALWPVLLFLLSRSLLAAAAWWSRRPRQRSDASVRHRPGPVCLLALPLALVFPQQAKAQKTAEGKTPKLVISIYIDRLDEDCLRWFMDGMEADGLRKLFSEGRVYTDVSYDTRFADGAIVTAGLVTGAPPLFHGIIGESWYNTASETLESCVFDPGYIGNYTVSTCSPNRLLVSTVGDELRGSTLNRSRVYCIGLDPEEVIVSGGHQANGAFWIDDDNGKWCTSTYYNYMPRWLENINDLSPDPIPAAWTPRYALSRYQHMPHLRHSLFFNHTLKGNDRVRRWKQTPLANTRVLDLARELITDERLGQDDCPDLLNLHFNLGDILDGNDRLSSMEIEDFYFCFDDDLGAFITDVENRLGRENVLWVVTATGTPVYPVSELKSTPAFSPDRCGVLLNLFLSALYGDGRWVIGQTDRDIYLNRPLIDGHQLAYTEVCRKAAELVAQVEGIRQVSVTQDFIVSAGSHADASLLNNFCKGRSGDLMFTVETGRNIVWESYPTHNRLLRQAHPSTFTVFYGCGIQSARLSDQVSVFDIAPTLCRLLRIRPPTACQGKALFDELP